MRYFSVVKFIICYTAIATLSFGRVLAQIPQESDPFPQFHPILSEVDEVGNAYPYYSYLGLYPDCSTGGSDGLNCERASFQYVFGEGRTSGDGNSDCDVYFTDEPNPYGNNLKPLAILLHGGSGNRKTVAMRRRAVDLARRGYVVAVPDYLTARDSLYGSEGNATELPCYDAHQKWYMLQQSIRDVYSVARSIMRLSTLGFMNEVQVDPDAIYLFGVSHGAFTALHAAALDETDFPQGAVDFENGNSFFFADNLSDQAICAVAGGCTDFEPYPGYNVRNAIKAIACSAPFTFSPELIDPLSMPPVLLFHGTCDASAPYWFATQGDAILRAAWAQFPGLNASLLPCQQPDDPYDELYGSGPIFEHLETEDPTGEQYRGLVTFCGGRHDLSNMYGSTSVDPNNVSVGILDYEFMRFFANVANDSFKENFSMVIDDGLRVATAEDEATTLAHCGSVQAVGELPEEAALICPTCESNASLYLSALRLPYFRLGNDDSNRYPALQEYAEALVDCGQQLGTENVEASQLDLGTLRNVFDLTGKSVMHPEWQGMTLSEMLAPAGMGLSKGCYILLFDSGLRRAMCVK